MIQQKLTESKTTMILITKTLVIFQLSAQLHGCSSHSGDDDMRANN